MMDDQRVKSRNSITMPDQIWIADWNGKANTTSSYIRSTGWQPYSRMKQYRGAKTESWGGVRINIDRNYLNLRTPKLPGAKPAQSQTPPPRYTGTSLTDPLCNPKSINRSSYRKADAKSFKATIITLQCLLKQRHAYKYAATGKWNSQTLKGLNAFQSVAKHPVRSYVTQTNWMALLTKGASGGTLQSGSSGADVVRGAASPERGRVSRPEHHRRLRRTHGERRGRLPEECRAPVHRDRGDAHLGGPALGQALRA